MKKYTIVIPILCFCSFSFLSSGCGSGGGTQPVSVTKPAALALNTDTALQVGETRRIDNTDTTIKLDAITSDTRCPRDGNCGVAGTVAMRLLVSDTTVKEERFMLTWDINGLTIPQTQTRAGYKITIQDVVPRFRPEGNSQTEATISQKDYTITVRVTPQ